MNNRFLNTSVRILAVTVFCVAAYACSGMKPAPSDATKNAATPDAAPAKPAEKPAAPTGPVAIEGGYTVAGTNPAGTPYKGSLEVIKHDQVYQFRWDAGKQYDGVGVLQDGVVAVSFCEGEDGKGCGVVCFKIGADGSLDGKWGMWGTDDGGSEKATRTGGAGTLEGSYTLAGKNPNGSDYKGTLQIAKTEGGYNLAWSNGSTGFGIVRGDHLTVGFGGAKCGFVAYDVKSDGSLVGVWGGPGTNDTGSETATRK